MRLPNQPFSNVNSPKLYWLFCTINCFASMDNVIALDYVIVWCGPKSDNCVFLHLSSSEFSNSLQYLNPIYKRPYNVVSSAKDSKFSLAQFLISSIYIYQEK